MVRDLRLDNLNSAIKIVYCFISIGYIFKTLLEKFGEARGKHIDKYRNPQGQVCVKSFGGFRDHVLHSMYIVPPQNYRKQPIRNLEEVKSQKLSKPG